MPIARHNRLPVDIKLLISPVTSTCNLRPTPKGNCPKIAFEFQNSPPLNIYLIIPSETDSTVKKEPRLLPWLLYLDFLIFKQISH